jgi:nitrogen-specific signal transduction histidine kinase
MDLAVTISPILNSDGSPAGSSAIVRDVTEDKLRQRELLTNQKMEAIGQLAGGVAHDFNNLLTVINGYARMLLRKGSADPTKVEAILQAGERGQRLTKQLLVFSRKQITQFKPVNLNSLVLGFLDMLRPLIGVEVELRTVLAPDLDLVMVDASQMEQVIMNLVVNARDAMPGGGIVTIETRNVKPVGASAAPGTVVLSVSDTGVGMSPEVQARIFEPFFTTKESGRGTGLGLSTSCGIVASCHGKFGVTSEIGRGTTFTIQLPACPDPDSVQPSSDGQADTAAAPQPVVGTILLAEDDPTVRAYVISVLQDRGYHVLAAENGAKALELCAEYRGSIDGLVTDVVMPEVNGLALAERARAMRPDLKVLFVSGYVDRKLKDEDILIPSYSFLEKPFTGEALLEIVDGFCSGPKRS